MREILAKASRSKRTKSALLLVSLHLAEDLNCIKADFGSELNTRIKELRARFADISQEPQGLPPHRGIFDHKIRLTAYPKRQRRNRLFVPEYEELKRQCTNTCNKPMPYLPVLRLKSYKVSTAYGAVHGTIIVIF